jgi:hypothetical protein
VEFDREDQDTLLHTVVERFKQSSAISQGQIAGRPAAEVMAERLAALPWPEVVLLAGLMTEPMQVAAEAWMVAMSVDVQDENPHPEGVMPLDRTVNSANDPEGLLNSVNDQAGASACSVSAAHTSIGDNASPGEQLGSATVTAERGDDDADAKVRADSDQLLLLWSGEEQPPREQALPLQEIQKRSTQEPPTATRRPARDEEPKDSPARPRTRRSKQAVANGQGSGASGQTALDHTTPGAPEDTGEGATTGIPAPHHDEDAAEPVTDAGRPIGVSAPADHGDSASVDLTQCGWCGGTQFLAMSKELGHIFCECGSVYNPSAGHWAPGRQDRRQSPPAPQPATAA